MPVRREIPESQGIYFITFTCARWLKLFQLTDSYDLVYKWFDYLLNKGHYIIAFVIMPNHIHAIIAFRNTGQKNNTIVGNGKRFIAYGLVERLKDSDFYTLLQPMSDWVKSTDKIRNKKHEVFEPSFDWKECNSEEFVEQKLEYIHFNPCRGEDCLAENPEDFVHSSAGFYIKNIPGRIPITTYLELQDIDLTKSLVI